MIKSEAITVNGIKQWIFSIRLNDENPILLFVHGGPGAAATPLFMKYQAPLADKATLVSWEQRGAGKSYSREIFKDKLTIDIFVGDLIAVSEQLNERYNKKKLFLIGHSWGGFISMMAASARPELFSACICIGAGQFGDKIGNQLYAYQSIAKKAVEANHRRSMSELLKMGTPPYGADRAFETSLCLRRWAWRFGGLLKDKRGYSSYLPLFFCFNNYTFSEKLNCRKAYIESMRCLEPDIMRVKTIGSLLKVPVPLHFIQGRHDLESVETISRFCFDSIISNDKTYYIYENSAHCPQWEEHERFNDFMIDVINEYGEKRPVH
jgi:pimeloyl-ACP methyl ester carboxylesterase